MKQQRKRLMRNRPRKPNVLKQQQHLKWVPALVVRRCPECYGHFKTTAGDYTPHQCPSLPSSSLSDARTGAEAVSGQVAA